MRPDSHGLIGPLFFPPEEKAEQGTDYMLQEKSLHQGLSANAWLHEFRNKRVNGPTLGHGLIAKMNDFSKSDLLDPVPGSSSCKSDFPQWNTQTRGDLGRGLS